MQKKKKLKSRYSDFREWCSEKHIPLLVFPLVFLIITGFITICIGGTIAGWEIAKALTSPMAYLVYVIIIGITAWCVFSYLNKRNSR